MSALLTRTERLDRLPYTRRHNKLLIGSGVGWALDAMDIGLISFIMAALAKEWSLSGGELSLLGSVGFVGMAFGASLGGLLADRIGRRQVFALTLLIYGVATGLSALSTGLVALIAFRFVVGLGLGAELPVASTLVSEFAPRKIRGRVVVALESFWAVGWLAAATIGFFVVPQDNGWRWALALGAIPAAYSLIVRFGLPESVRFLEAKGRHAEAERVVRDFESAAGIASPTHAAAESPVLPTLTSTRRDLWGDRFRVRTIALWLTWFGINFAYYGAFIWLPTLLFEGGMTLVKSFEFTLYMTLAQLPGYATAAFLIEKWGRRPTLVTFLGGSVVGAVAFGLAPGLAAAVAPGDEGTGFAVTLAAGCVLSFFNLGAWGALYAITPEVYPTAMRATGAGAATAFGRIAAMAAPLVVPWVVAAAGRPVLFGLFGAMFTVAMIAAWFLPEYTDRALDET
ncbi:MULTISPECIES: MFS transporter [Tessaracoccus]|jgi:putative MFS transporter|uniref:MFS transporter n=1 Tax=Tessaracoccus TaxID=72763 RepID=UPI00099B2B71|nr:MULTISPECIES: MFS transporter [Tessaracoccus]AQX16242.1 MFS transporter [Tessaracoccus sp. T2.5-30]VEP40829.1 Putative niacin/nicotinamide transporter NaiP [Tessaracoccus lapidicaptus]